jgi:hypothetical protein
MYIAAARQIFQKKFFSFFLQGKLPQEVKKKEVFMKNLRGASNISYNFSYPNCFHD